MLPRANLQLPRLAGVCFFLVATTATFAQLEPQGLLLYQEPSTSYTEAWEYRSFRQENALYATVVTFNGERKKLKAAGVLNIVPYPPLSFDPDFPKTAKNTLEKIDGLAQSYPLVKQELEKARGKWTRALSVYNQTQSKSGATPASQEKPAAISVAGAIFQNARISSATPERVTLRHASGVTTVPLAELTATQVLALNRTSDQVQLPLGIMRVAAKVKPANPQGALTQRIGTIGRGAIDFCAEKFGINSEAFSVWLFFVVLPVAVLLLLLGLIVLARRSAG
jgi:hypothetical protein